MNKREKEKLPNKMILAIILTAGLVALVLIAAAALLVKYGIDKKYEYEQALANEGTTKATEGESGKAGETDATDETDAVDESGEDDSDILIDDVAPEFETADAASMPDFWKFAINGTDYEMPMALSALEELGYLMDTEDTSSYILKAGYGHQEYLYASSDTDREDPIGLVEVYNPFGMDKAESECRVVSFCVYSENALANALKLAGGITFSSTQDDVVAAYGKVSLEETDEDVTTLYWILDENFYNVLMLEFSEGALSAVSIDYSAPYPDYTFNLDIEEEEYIEEDDLEEDELDEEDDLEEDDLEEEETLGEPVLVY